VSRRPEQRLWDRVRDGLREASLTPDVLAQGNHILELDRVENAAAKSMPDVFGRWGQFDFWIELKVAPLKFQPGQASWLARQWECRSNSWLLVDSPLRSCLYRGEQAPELAGKLLVAAELIQPSWPKLLERLTWGACPDACGCTENAHT
jgi:hypothetical protein